MQHYYKFNLAKKDSTSAVIEFIADSATFSNYMSFYTVKTLHGPNPALGGMAHGGNDSTVTRVVHEKGNQERVGGLFPIGTVFLKHSTSPNGMNEITAIVKRGNNFDSSHNNWEYFVLNPNGSIKKDAMGMEMRGANIMMGMCRNCHSAASSQDFIFSK